METIRADVAVIGAGLIGAAAAYHASAHTRVVLIEQESQPGYHSSGRSAAVLLPPYGGPIARSLTAGSTGFLFRPPDGFTDVALTSPRGALFVASESQLTLLDRWRPDRGRGADRARVLTGVEAALHVPILRTESIAAAVLLSDVRDIDATALLQGYTKALRARGATLLLDSAVGRVSRADGVWLIETTSSIVRASILVNAAGAWADDIAALAGIERKGLVPTRRTMIVVDAPAGVDVRRWPLVADAGEAFYFKPDAGRLLVSPADCTPVAPQDVQPEEWDVAVAVERLEAATSLRVRRVAHRWAGLRTMTGDGEPIVGFDLAAPTFLWAAGFGGFGVQTAAAAGRCCAALICGEQLPADLSEVGVDLERLSPRRLARAQGRPQA